jgi:hypothetical protein
MVPMSLFRVGRHLLWIAVIGLVCGLTPSLVAASIFYIDRFEVVQNGTKLHVDDFDDGLVPPSSPSDLSYFTRGEAGPEAGGKLALDTAIGESRQSTITGVPLLVQTTLLLTDATTGGNGGLRADDDIEVVGLWDLAKPSRDRERYGMRLVDFVGDTFNDVMEVSVLRDSMGNTRVVFREADPSAPDPLDRYPILESFDLVLEDFATYEQIEFGLFTAANDPIVQPSARLIDTDGINADKVLGFTATGSAFELQDWTRAQFMAIQVVPLPGTLPLTLSALGWLGFLLTKRRRP